MPITHAIAHHLIKNTDESSTLSLRNNELTIDEQQEALFDTLKKSFQTRLSRKHGSFDANLEDSTLQQEMELYWDNKEYFQAFTHKFMTVLENKMNEGNGELNAHFLFFIEKTSTSTGAYLFIVYQNEMLTIDQTLDIKPIYSIDTGSRISGVKLNITDWKNRPNYHYLTLVPPKGNETLSDALHEISGFGNKIDKSKSTHEFLENLQQFTSQLPKDQQKSINEKVVEYCEDQESKDEAVHIPTLSQNLDGIDCEKFIREMLPNNPLNESDEPVDEELMIDKKSLRRYVKFSGRDKDLSLTFSTNQLNETVIYDESTESLIINQIPKGLKKQLVSHFKRLAHGSYK